MKCTLKTIDIFCRWFTGLTVKHFMAAKNSKKRVKIWAKKNLCQITSKIKPFLL